MVKPFNLLWFGVLLAVQASAAWRDPTQPMVSQVITANPQVTPKQALVLSAIWLSANSRRALLNGVLVKEGQVMPDGLRVISIRQNQVTVKRHDKQIVLHLLQRQTVKDVSHYHD